MQPWIRVRVELFTRPFLPSPLSPHPHRKGLGTKLCKQLVKFGSSADGGSILGSDGGRESMGIYAPGRGGIQVAAASGKGKLS